MADEDQDETGHEAVSTDGEGASQDELKRRREARAGGSAKDRAALEAEQRALDAEDGRGDDGDDDQMEFLVPASTKRMHFGTMVPPKVPVTIKYKMSGKAVPKFRGGLMDPTETNALLLVPVVVESAFPSYTRNDDLTIKSVTIVVTLAPREIVNAVSEEGEMLMKAAMAAAQQTVDAANG